MIIIYIYTYSHLKSQPEGVYAHDLQGVDRADMGGLAADGRNVRVPAAGPLPRQVSDRSTQREESLEFH